MKWVEKFNCSNSREGIENRMRLRGMDIANQFIDNKYVKAKVTIEIEKSKVKE